MIIIRPELLKDVLKALSSHLYLELEDFNVNEFINKDQEPCLSIKYRANNRFFFDFHIPKKGVESSTAPYFVYPFVCSISPGRESVDESMVVVGRSRLLVEIREWLKNLYADIVSEPAIRQFEAKSAAIEQLRRRLDKLPDEPLSHADVIQFRKELDRMKIEFSAQLKQATSNKKELTRKVQELSRDIEFLKQTLESMTKRQWGEVFFRMCSEGQRG
jgi:hypothetical protein